MLAIIDYEAGNLTSVRLAVEHVGGDCVVTQDPAVVASAQRVIFPGVGSAKSCMHNLRRLGLDKALLAALDSGKPVMAICIGMQLIFESSEEDGGVDCLGILKGQVKRFDFPPQARVKVPHMGWNEVVARKPHHILHDLPAHGECYFVHSYHACAQNPAEVYAVSEYEGREFVCAVGRGNLFATQFHPEKSGTTGLAMLRNFLSWDGKEC